MSSDQVQVISRRRTSRAGRYGSEAGASDCGSVAGISHCASDAGLSDCAPEPHWEEAGSVQEHSEIRKRCSHTYNVYETYILFQLSWPHYSR